MKEKMNKLEKALKKLNYSYVCKFGDNQVFRRKEGTIGFIFLYTDELVNRVVSYFFAPPSSKIMKEKVESDLELLKKYEYDPYYDEGLCNQVE